MKYVRHFSENWYIQLIDDFERAFQELFYKLSAYNSTINRVDLNLQPTPVSANGVDYPFPLAKKVHEIYQWLSGNRKTPPAHTEDTLEEILSIVYFNPFIDLTELSHDIEWERWKGMHTGFFYQITKVALKLHTGESINASELAMMLHISQVAVLKQIKTGKIPAEKKGNTWVIDGKLAQNYVEQYNKKNPFEEIKENEWVLE